MTYEGSESNEFGNEQPYYPETTGAIFDVEAVAPGESGEHGGSFQDGIAIAADGALSASVLDDEAVRSGDETDSVELFESIDLTNPNSLSRNNADEGFVEDDIPSNDAVAVTSQGALPPVPVGHETADYRQRDIRVRTLAGSASMGTLLAAGDTGANDRQKRDTPPGATKPVRASSEPSAPQAPDASGTSGGADPPPPRPPHLGGPEGSSDDGDGEGDYEQHRVRKATEARDNFERQFRVTVPTTVRSVRNFEPYSEAHPNTVAMERHRPDGPISLLVRVDAAEDPTQRGCIVRIPYPGEGKSSNPDRDHEERVRTTGLLDGPNRGKARCGITEELVAYDSRYHGVTRFVCDTATGGEPQWEQIENPDRAVYLLQATDVNMPKLQLRKAGRFTGAVPLEPDVERAIIYRARDIADIPYGQDLSLNYRERAVLNGIIDGTKGTVLADQLSTTVYQITQTTKQLQARFGARTREALVYSTLAHGVGVNVNIRATARDVRLTDNQAFHFYLAATGWGVEETAALLGRGLRVITGTREEITEGFGTRGLGTNVNTIQAIVVAFANGYFVPLPPEGEHLGPISPERQAYIARNYATNMPLLSLARTGSGDVRDVLSYGRQHEIRSRAREVVSVLYGQPQQLTAAETAILHGYAMGRTSQRDIANDIGVSPKTVSRIIVGLEKRFGVADPTALMYSLLLGGVDIGNVVDAHMSMPALSPNQRLQLYLACLGYNERDAARLVGRSEDTVEGQLAEVRRRFGGVSMPRAVALAFGLGYYHAVNE